MPLIILQLISWEVDLMGVDPVGSWSIGSWFSGSWSRESWSRGPNSAKLLWLWSRALKGYMWQGLWESPTCTFGIAHTQWLASSRLLTDDAWTPPSRASGSREYCTWKTSNSPNLYGVSGFVCVATPPYVWTDHEERPMKLSFSSRMMALGVNAVVSEVSMPQFTATLRNLCFPPWRDSPRELACSWFCIVWLLRLSVHAAFCLLLYFCMPILGESDKWTSNFKPECGVHVLKRVRVKGVVLVRLYILLPYLSTGVRLILFRLCFWLVYLTTCSKRMH